VGLPAAGASRVITLVVDAARLAAGEGSSASGVVLRLEGDAYRHLFRARRLGVGERLRLVDGLGQARWGEVVGVGRSGAEVALQEVADGNEPALRVELLVPTLRPERAAWLVEKATELGVTAVRFHNSERAPRAFGAGAMARLRRVAIAAVEQCHRSRCPEIFAPHSLAEAAAAAAGPPRWLLDPTAPAGDLALAAAAGAPAGASVLVGPEGGWAPAELAAIVAAGWRTVSLGPRVLRIETAAIGAAALLLLGRQ
jgi:16S rRNA (uracil1498-N3)-methyltransferase